MTTPQRRKPLSESDGERSKLVTVGYAVFIALGLVFLFRRFIFSDYMIISHDPIAFGVFWRSFLRESLMSHGSVPAWNPWICCGIPFVEAIHGGIYYPLSVIDYIGNIFRAISYNFILHFFLAGMFMFATARRFGLSKAASAVAGVAYMFSPCLISWVAPGHDGKIFAATWFPLLILFADRALRERKLVDSALMGLVYGIIILTPHLQLAYYAAGAVGLYAIYVTTTNFLEKRNSRLSLKTTALFAGGMLLGVAIGAVQFVPSVAYLTTDSPRAEAHKSYEFAAQYSLRAEEAFSQVVPEFSGVNLKTGERRYWGKNSMKDNSESAGTIPIFLALLAFLIPGRGVKRFWGGLAALVFLYSLGPSTPVFGWLLKIVPFAHSVAGPSTSMFIFVFSVALLSGMAVQGLREGTTPRWKWLLWLGPVVLGGVALLFTIDPEGMLRLYCRFFNPGILPSDGNIPAKWTPALANLPDLMLGFWLAAGALLIAALLVRLSMKSTRRALILWCLPLLVAGMGVYFNQRFVTVFTPQLRFGDHPVIDVIKQYEGWNRTATYGLYDGAFQFGWYHIPSPIGPHGKEPRWFFDLIGGYHRGNMFNSRVLNLTATRFIVSPRDKTLPATSMSPLPADTIAALQQFTIVENPNRFPQAYLASDYRVFESVKDLYPQVLNGADDLRQTVYLEEEPSLKFDGAMDSAATAEVSYYGTDSVVINTSASGNALLVLSDTWYSAWKARVDSSAAKIHRAYGAFRAVEVPTGDHRVAFSYHSTAKEVGWWLTLAGLLTVVSVVVASLFSRR